MALIGISKKLAKYHLKKKSGNDLEFEEAVPFIHNDAEKILGSRDQVNNYSKLAPIVIIFLIGILSLQTFKLQVIDKSKFADLAENNRLKEITFRADRGIIYDKNKNILVKNKAIFDLTAIPKEIPRDAEKISRIVADIAELAGREPSEISAKLDKMDHSSNRTELILDNMDISRALALETAREKMPGFEIKNNAIREYPDAKYFSHIIGYIGRVRQDDLDSDKSYETTDFIGKEGLESQYEKYLRGEKGSEIIETDAWGTTISVLNTRETKTGENLVLSLDAALQKKLQDSLEDALKKINGIKNNRGAAAAVAMDPRNGKILAMVSLPSYDNNIFADPANKGKITSVLNDSGSPLINRVISGVYPPGSTIKPVMGTAALSEGIIDKKTIIMDTGVIDVISGIRVTHFRGWNPAGLGPMNIVSAIAQSSDIFFYTVGGGYGNFKGLGVGKIAEYFRKFNLGGKLGIDLPGEVDGFVPTSEWKKGKFGEDWTLGNTYHISIGQGYLLATPLQVASWTSVMANKGTIFKPYLVDKIISGEDGSVIKEFAPQAINNSVADQKYINIIRAGMREAVLTGSARALKNLNIEVAGKTGTAEYGTAGNTHAWFTSFAPYDNPEIVLTMLIENGGEGGITVVPIAKDILSWYFGNKSGSVANSPE